MRLEDSTDVTFKPDQNHSLPSWVYRILGEKLYLRFLGNLPKCLKILIHKFFSLPNLSASRKHAKNPLVLRNNCRRNPRSLPSTDTTRVVSTRLTCHRCRTLARTGGRSEGSPCTHLQPEKQTSFSEGRTSIPLSNSNIWSPKAVPLLPNISHTGSEMHFPLPTDGFLPMTHRLKGLLARSGFSFSII